MKVFVIVNLSIDFLLYDLMLMRLDCLVSDSCNAVSIYIMCKLSFNGLGVACG